MVGLLIIRNTDLFCFERGLLKTQNSYGPRTCLIRHGLLKSCSNV